MPKRICERTRNTGTQRAMRLGPFPGFQLSPAPLWLAVGVAEQDVGDREWPGGMGQRWTHPLAFLSCQPYGTLEASGALRREDK